MYNCFGLRPLLLNYVVDLNYSLINVTHKHTLCNKIISLKIHPQDIINEIYNELLFI